MEKVFDKTNVIFGMLASVGAYLLGPYWFLFAAFLFLNVVDYITGWMKAKYFKKNESSKIGAKGVCKKVMYWFIIGVSFLIGIAFKEIGVIIGVNLGFMVFVGYLTLATYIINESRSIAENAYDMNLNVPKFLIQGLDIVEKKINEVGDTEVKEEKGE